MHKIINWNTTNNNYLSIKGENEHAEAAGADTAVADDVDN